MKHFLFSVTPQIASISTALSKTETIRGSIENSKTNKNLIGVKVHAGGTNLGNQLAFHHVFRILVRVADLKTFARQTTDYSKKWFSLAGVHCPSKILSVAINHLTNMKHYI